MVDETGRNDLRDRRELEAAGGHGHEHHEHHEHELHPTHEHDVLGLLAGRMVVTVGRDEERPERILLALRDQRTAQRFSAFLSPLELDVLAYGLSKIAQKVGKEEQSR